MFLRTFFCSLGILGLFATVSTAQEGPKPFPQFNSRWVKPPTAATKHRPIIQIDPDQPDAGTIPSLADSSKHQTLAQSRYDWFWEKVSPDLTESGPGRLSSALQVLNGSGKVSAPRLQAMQDIAIVQAIPILRSTVGTNVSPALVLAVIAVESAGKVDAVSIVGATGLMQLMPATAERFGVTDSLVADDNIAGGVRYLDWLMEKFDRDPILVLAGYNAGEGAVRDHGGVPPFAETRDYVPKVLAAFQVARGLCTTPPELITDGCVFATMK